MYKKERKKNCLVPYLNSAVCNVITFPDSCSRQINVHDSLPCCSHGNWSLHRLKAPGLCNKWNVSQSLRTIPSCEGVKRSEVNHSGMQTESGVRWVLWKQGQKDKAKAMSFGKVTENKLTHCSFLGIMILIFYFKWCIYNHVMMCKCFDGYDSEFVHSILKVHEPTAVTQL